VRERNIGRVGADDSNPELSAEDLRARLSGGWRANRSSPMRIGALPRISKERLLIRNAMQMRDVSAGGKRNTLARLVTRAIVATCVEYLEKSFSSFFTRKTFT
jgi:hypothetical protein